MRIYLLLKVLRIDKFSCLPNLKLITVLLYDFSTKNEKKSTYTFVVEVVFTLQPKAFSEVLSTVNQLF